MEQKDIQIKDTNSTEDSLVDVLNFVLTKIERLTSALYMVTNVLPDSEPLKWKLRDKGLSLMTDTNKTLKTILFTHLADQKQTQCPSAEKVTTGLEEILSLIEVAIGSGSVSLMNFTILKKEYSALKEMVLKNFSADQFSQYLLTGEESKYPLLPVVDKLPLTSSPFKIDNREVLARETTSNIADVKSPTRVGVPKSLSHSHRDGHLASKVKTVSNQTEASKNYLLDIEAGPMPTKTTAPSASKGQGGLGKSDRQAIILKFLQGKDWASIKDISDQMSGYSTKTVQRELVAMVETNVLKKTGDRRWSRYKIA